MVVPGGPGQPGLATAGLFGKIFARQPKQEERGGAVPGCWGGARRESGQQNHQAEDVG